ncbi:MAG TPA: sigma-70 family RNA polymerase sigma factor [Pyrinomonadaceae bacterium]|nr:sigma-70 family RNA polymerase sigma factor [Pyrinomonadaceae bacterium]
MFKVETSSGLLFMDGEGRRAAEEAAAPRPAPAPPEAALVEAVRAGDREAFAGLYETFAPMVHGVLLARVPFDEVGDLVQEVFLVAFRKLDTLRDGARFGPWVAMIARNRAMDFHRRARETEELRDELAHAPRPSAEAAEALAHIRALPEAYRETLVLRLVEGMTGPEIAARTGLQPASVRVNLHRGMKLLRERLAGKGPK